MHRVSQPPYSPMHAERGIKYIKYNVKYEYIYSLWEHRQNHVLCNTSCGAQVKNRHDASPN